jgi:hypothetical protein
MAPWTIQLITLAGVAVGALASFTSTSLTDRNRWRREETRRLNTERLQCYSQFASVIQRYIDFAYHTAAGLGLPVGDEEPLDTDTGLAGLTTTRAELNVEFQRVLMIGSPRVIAAAREYQHQAWYLERFARGRLHDPDTFIEAGDSRREARRRFYSEVRADLDVTSGGIPRSDDVTPSQPGPDTTSSRDGSSPGQRW